MRITNLIFVGSLAALVTTMAPALAKNSQIQKPEEQATSSPCRAYQQAADGTWSQLPCEAPGSSKPSREQQAGDRQPARRNPL
jgi:hypothetical protein